MAEKKYYWLKLDRNFFKRHDVRIVEDMPNGKEYVLFYLKMLVESIDHEGSLRFNELIPYNDQMLSTITNTNIDIVRSAIKVLQSLSLLEIWDDQTIYLNDTTKMLGEKSEWAVKKAQWRAKQLENKDIERTKKDNVRQEIDKEIELDIEKDNNTVRKTTRFVKPSVTDIESYAKENNLKIDAIYFFNHYEANGWMVGRNKMKDWKKTVDNWVIRDNKNQFGGKRQNRTEQPLAYEETDVIMSTEEVEAIKRSFKEGK